MLYVGMSMLSIPVWSSTRTLDALDDETHVVLLNISSPLFISHINPKILGSPAITAFVHQSRSLIKHIMSTESTTKKSGRTPEQQAARDARKAAKAAAAAASTAPTTTIPSNEVELPHAESSKQAIAASAPAPKSDKKRTRAERDQANDPTSTKGEAQVDEDGDLLEIDVTAPEPLSKAEARAARKRQKKGLPDLPPKLTKPDKPRRDGSPAEGEEDGQTGEGKEKKEKTKQRMNSVWIGNLSFRTTAESLKTYLEKGITEKGAVGHGAVTRVNLPKKPGKGEFAPNKG